jgi:hypothetical protein
MATTRNCGASAGGVAALAPIANARKTTAKGKGIAKRQRALLINRIVSP